jgi:hypothetical protein
MHADQLLADGLDQQSCDNGAIHAAGQSQQNLLVTHLSTNGCDLLGDELLSLLKGGNASHGFGTNIAIHIEFLLKNLFGVCIQIRVCSISEKQTILAQKHYNE